jgi:hypothetical protein
MAMYRWPLGTNSGIEMPAVKKVKRKQQHEQRSRSTNHG